MEEELDLEEQRERNFYFFTLRIIFLILVGLLTFGLLTFLTIYFKWSEFSLFCLAGSLSGVFLSVALLDSLKTRVWISLILGVLIFPLLALYWGSLVIRNLSAFKLYSSALVPFLSYLIALVFVGVIVGKFWPRKETVEKIEKGGQEEVSETVTPEEKPTSEEKTKETSPGAVSEEN